MERLIKRRQKLAEDLNSADLQLSDWLDKKGITVPEEVISSGCMMYAEPYASAEIIRREIERK